MDLNIAGESVRRVDDSGFAPIIEFSGHYTVHLEGDFVYRTRETAFVMSPDRGDETMLHALAGQTVTAASAEDFGSLTLKFADGSEIVCAPDDEYEAWGVTGPHGMRVISMPGGELAIWSAER